MNAPPTPQLPRRLALLLLGSTLLMGLGGCQHFTQLSQWAHAHFAKASSLKVTPAPMVAAVRGPDAAEDSLYARGVAAIDQRNYGFALDMLQLAREARPNDPRVLSAMGVVYDKLGRFDLSKRYYDLAEAADPGSKVVAIDRSYSAVLQQRSLAERSPEAVELAEAPAITSLALVTQAGRIVVVQVPIAPVGRLIAPPAAPIIQADAGSLLLGGRVHIRNATGAAGGADFIRTRLVDHGWHVAPAEADARKADPASRLQFPPRAQRVATGLARTLPFPVKLDSCTTCTLVELVVGTDALPKGKAAKRPEARRG